jgi:hypothetical protein
MGWHYVVFREEPTQLKLWCTVAKEFDEEPLSIIHAVIADMPNYLFDLVTEVAVLLCHILWRLPSP